MADKIQWIDGNCPGTVFQGTATQMAELNADGGSAIEVHVDLLRPAGAAELEAKILASRGIPEAVMPINDWVRRDA